MSTIENFNIHDHKSDKDNSCLICGKTITEIGEGGLEYQKLVRTKLIELENRIKALEESRQ